MRTQTTAGTPPLFEIRTENSRAETARRVRHMLPLSTGSREDRKRRIRFPEIEWMLRLYRRFPLSVVSLNPQDTALVGRSSGIHHVLNGSRQRQ